MIRNILKKMNLNEEAIVAPFFSEEDGSAYQVYKVQYEAKTYVLKKTTEKEVNLYQRYLKGFSCVPKVYHVIQHEQDWYLLMSYEEGISLSRCTRSNLKLALDSLISLQDAYWNAISEDKKTVLLSRCKRLESMGDLQPVYQMYLDEFDRIPVTLTHDDLLPFNVLCDGQKAVLIDWNDAGILPYASSLARLIAYGQQDKQALFQMSKEDKQFALNYYYDHFISKKGIAYEEYEHTMNLFLFKEYSEWIYCAYLSGDYEMEYYKIYEPKARALAERLGF